MNINEINVKREMLAKTIKDAINDFEKEVELSIDKVIIARNNRYVINEHSSDEVTDVIMNIQI